jgi:hypothetical protein
MLMIEKTTTSKNPSISSYWRIFLASGFYHFTADYGLDKILGSSFGVIVARNVGMTARLWRGFFAATGGSVPRIQGQPRYRRWIRWALRVFALSQAHMNIIFRKL